MILVVPISNNFNATIIIKVRMVFKINPTTAIMPLATTINLVIITIIATTISFSKIKDLVSFLINFKFKIAKELSQKIK